MKRDKNLLPEHIPGGERLTKEDLAPVNRELKKLPYKAVGIFLSAICVFAVVSVILTSAIDGAIGNLLAVVLWISFPVIIAKVSNTTLKKTNKFCKELGISDENYKIALKNRTEDHNALGKDAKTRLNYRFVCKKCKKQTDWFSWSMTSCTKETLKAKENQFYHLAKEKKKFFEHKHGWVKYSLERTCPNCKVMQKKHAPTLLPILITFLVGFAIWLGAAISYMGETDIYNRSWFERSLADLEIMILIFIPLFAIFIARYLFGKKLVTPEYKFIEEE